MELIQGDLLKPFTHRFHHKVDLLVCFSGESDTMLFPKCAHYAQLVKPYCAAAAVCVRHTCAHLETCLGNAGTKALVMDAHIWLCADLQPTLRTYA